MDLTQTYLWEEMFRCRRCGKMEKTSLTGWLIQWPLCWECGQMWPVFKGTEVFQKAKSENPYHPGVSTIYAFLKWFPKGQSA